ncbi:MAG: glycosyltransferase family 4 protein [Planctomycetota bacterium]|nr:glycosyltransferase family 4 protein [Planctomycetota bacterium]
MKIALMTAGAAGMYCGSCLRDNALARALNASGEDALLIPTYTPITTDEENASIDRVFFGGLNVYLKQRFSLFRHSPAFLERALDSPKLLKLLTRLSSSTDASKLGDLTISMLKGEDGNQRAELETLIDWLETDFWPDLVNLPNALFAGMAGRIKERLNVPVLCTLTGEDIFLEGLEESDRNAAIELTAKKCAYIDGFISTSAYFADFMSVYLGIARDKIHVVPPGITVEDFKEKSKESSQPTIGYLARICPEKGLHELVDAFLKIKGFGDAPECRLRVAGYLGKRDGAYLDSLVQQIEDAGHIKDFECLGTVERTQKMQFLQSLDVFSVPTTYREPKGIFLLEAWAAGLPVVQPRHGSFPELIEATGGGLLFDPGNAAELADKIVQLLKDQELRYGLAASGSKRVRSDFTAERMAERTIEVYRAYLGLRE